MPREAQSLKSPHPLARFYVNIGGTQQPAALTQQTAVVFTLYPLETEQILVLPFLYTTLLGFFRTVVKPVSSKV